MIKEQVLSSESKACGQFLQGKKSLASPDGLCSIQGNYM